MTSINPFSSSDLPGVLSLLRASMTADAIPETRFTRQVLLDHNFRPDGAIVARDGNTVVGFCLALARQTPLENAPSDIERGYITLLAVAPSHQRRGIASKMLAQAEAYLRSQNRKLIMVSSYAPGYFIPGVDVNAYQPALAFFAKRNYKEIYRPLAMETSLWSFSIPQWVLAKQRELESAGLRILPYSPELTLPLLDFAKAEFPGDWVRVVRETAARILAGETPTRLLAAIESNTVVAFSHFENERFGPIGVAQSQRGRCLGQILMYRTLEAQRDSGFRAAWFLWSDDKTAARIYNNAGFRETRRFALLRKDLI